MSKQGDVKAQAAISTQIAGQLAEGRRLIELEIHTKKELERASARRSIWVENNVRLLKDCLLPDNVKTKLLSQAGLDSTDTGEDFAAELASFRDITKAQISVLENALTLLPESQEPSQAFDQTAEKSSITHRIPEGPLATISEANLSLKERLERHPIGVAAIICAACISIAFLVMNWYHGESEKLLINKYETQLSGMNNNMAAQRREFEETIRKLKEELEKQHPQGKKQED